VRIPELPLGQSKVSEIVNLKAFAEGGRDEAKPLSFERHALRTWLRQMEEAFAPFGRVLALR
jgi:hypothetical protein